MTPIPTRQKKNTPRSHRVMLSIGIVITGDWPNGHRFSEETRTSVVNAHGALILLADEVTCVNWLPSATSNRAQNFRARSWKSGSPTPVNPR